MFTILSILLPRYIWCRLREVTPRAQTRPDPKSITGIPTVRLSEPNTARLRPLAGETAPSCRSCEPSPSPAPGELSAYRPVREPLSAVQSCGRDTLHPGAGAAIGASTAVESWLSCTAAGASELPKPARGAEAFTAVKKPSAGATKLERATKLQGLPKRHCWGSVRAVGLPGAARVSPAPPPVRRWPCNLQPAAPDRVTGHGAAPAGRHSGGTRRT